MSTTITMRIQVTKTSDELRQPTKALSDIKEWHFVALIDLLNNGVPRQNLLETIISVQWLSLIQTSN